MMSKSKLIGCIASYLLYFCILSMARLLKHVCMSHRWVIAGDLFLLFKDPYRWILSRGKPTTQSSTDGSHVASYATDGDYNNYDLPMNYSKTTVSDKPYLQVDLEAIVSIDYVVLNFPMFSLNGDAYYRIRILVGEQHNPPSPRPIHPQKYLANPHKFSSSRIKPHFLYSFYFGLFYRSFDLGTAVLTCVYFYYLCIFIIFIHFI